MYQTFFIVGIICAVLGGGFLIASAIMFFGFNIPTLWKEWNGELEQKQIEEIRKNSSIAANQRGKVNVFEQLEQKAKVKKNNTHSLNAHTTSTLKMKVADPGTTVLQKNKSISNSDFIIEKNIIFVSTNEVM